MEELIKHVSAVEELCLMPWPLSCRDPLENRVESADPLLRNIHTHTYTHETRVNFKTS